MGFMLLELLTEVVDNLKPIVVEDVFKVIQLHLEMNVLMCSGMVGKNLFEEIQLVSPMVEIRIPIAAFLMFLD
jgi:hypothetical protein